MDKRAQGVVMASFVATMVAGCAGNNANSTPPSAGDMAGKVKCTGINSCRSKGACAQDGHACGGKNDCQGKGITLTSKDDCATKGGKAM